MNTKIKRLAQKLEVVKAEHKNTAGCIQAKIQAEYDKIFKADKALQADVKRLEASKDYGSDESGIYAWTRMKYVAPECEQAREYLETYLQENHSIHVDFKNDALQSYVGSCLIINEQGDVYSSDDGMNADKWIVDHSDYIVDGELDETKRNELIEAWMKANGYFQDVFSMDQYGNTYLVNTAKPKKAEGNTK